MELLGYWNIARGNAGKAEKYRTQDNNTIIVYTSYSTIVGIELYAGVGLSPTLLERHVLDSKASKTTGSHLNAISRDKTIREERDIFESNYLRITGARNMYVCLKNINNGGN